MVIKKILSTAFLLALAGTSVFAAHSAEDRRAFDQQLLQERQDFEKSLKNIKDPRQEEIEKVQQGQREAFKTLQERSQGADLETQKSLLKDYLVRLQKDRKALDLKLKDLNEKIKTGDIKLDILQEKRKNFNRRQANKVNQFLAQ